MSRYFSSKGGRGSDKGRKFETTKKQQTGTDTGPPLPETNNSNEIRRRMDLKLKVFALRNHFANSLLVNNDTNDAYGSNDSDSWASRTMMSQLSIDSITMGRNLIENLPHALLLYLSNSYLDDGSACALGQTNRHIFLAIVVHYQRQIFWPIDAPSITHLIGNLSIGVVTRIQIKRNIQELTQYRLCFPLVFNAVKELRLSHSSIGEPCIFPPHLHTLIYDHQPTVVDYQKLVNYPLSLTHLRFERINNMDFFLPLCTVPARLGRLEVILASTTPVSDSSNQSTHEAQQTHIFNQLHQWRLKHDLSTCEILITPAPPVPVETVDTAIFRF